MKLKPLFSCILTTVISVPVCGQSVRNDGTINTWGPQAGDWEFSLGGGGTNDKEFETGGFNVDAELGHYLTDDFAVALRQSGNYSDVGSDTAWSATSRVAIDYHFPLFEDRLRPFIGANLGYVYGENVDDTWAAGPEAGVKWYVKDETFIYGRAEYQFLFEDGDDAEDRFDDGIWLYTVGIGFNF